MHSGARFKTRTEVRCPPACFSCSRSVAAWCRVHLHGFALVSLTHLLVLAHLHSCILSRPARQLADVLQQFSTRWQLRLWRPCLLGAFCPPCRIRTERRRCSNGDPVATFCASPSHLISFFKPGHFTLNHINPQLPCTSSPGVSRILQSSGSCMNGRLVREPSAHA